MSSPVEVTKENRMKFVGKKGVYQIMNRNDEPVLKRNGKPWTGKTLNMGNYYGVLVGSGKYKQVKLSTPWIPSYKILFTEAN